jgi:hypothetical protein
VSFVMDYVEFRINYNVLRAYRPPMVELHDGTFARFPEPGSRDALCRLIDSTVTRAAETTVDGRKVIEVETDRSDVLRIDVDDGSDPFDYAQLVPVDEGGVLQVAQMVDW